MPVTPEETPEYSPASPCDKMCDMFQTDTSNCNLMKMVGGNNLNKEFGY